MLKIIDRSKYYKGNKHGQLFVIYDDYSEKEHLVIATSFNKACGYNTTQSGTTYSNKTNGKIILTDKAYKLLIKE